jgi:hypothetical protein
LILSGEIDPITPPENGTTAKTMLSHSRHIIVPNQGHGVLSRGCLPTLIRDFVESTNLEGLNTTCVQRERATPFFVDTTGPRP